MRQNDMPRSLNPVRAIALLWIAFVALVGVVGLVIQLVTLAGPRLKTAPDAWTVVSAVLSLLLGIITLATVHVPRRHRVGWIVDMRRHYPFLLRGLNCHVLGLTLCNATILVAPFSLPIAWVMAYTWLGLLILAGAMVVWGLKRGEGEWLQEESSETENAVP